jgi:hypothetical protein
MIAMPMIQETSVPGFLNAMNAAFEVAYNAANDPSVARNPFVVQALAAAKEAHRRAVSAAHAAQGAKGFFRTLKATREASKAAYLASMAEGNLRAAIEEASAASN